MTLSVIAESDSDQAFEFPETFEFPEKREHQIAVSASNLDLSAEMALWSSDQRASTEDDLPNSERRACYMPVDVDYYAVLGVARNANEEAIEAAVKKSMREWRKRTEAADMGVRQEAEIKVKQIEDARTILLDQAKRIAYDGELLAGVNAPAAPTVGQAPDGRSWVDQAEGFLAVGDYHSAAYAGREATHVEATNARAWWVRSRANAGLRLWQDALYEAKQAVQLDNGNAEYHFNLGLVHEQMGQFAEAIDEYRRASTCDPSNPMYELAVGGVFASNGRPDEALPIIEAVYSRHPQDSTTNYYLGMVLIDLAESVPSRRDRDSYFVTSQSEIDKMRQFATRANSLNIVDQDLREQADGILRYLDRMEEKAFRPPRQLIGTAMGAGMEAGCLAGAIVIFLVGALILAPVILVLGGFSVMDSSPGAGLLMILVGGALGYVWYRLSYIPRWKHNKKDIG